MISFYRFEKNIKGVRHKEFVNVPGLVYFQINDIYTNTNNKSNRAEGNKPNGHFCIKKLG